MVHILFNGTDNDLHETFIRKHHKEDEDSELGLHLQLQIICWKTHISAHKLKSHGNMADSEEKKNHDFAPVYFIEISGRKI